MRLDRDKHPPVADRHVGLRTRRARGAQGALTRRRDAAYDRRHGERRCSRARRAICVKVLDRLPGYFLVLTTQNQLLYASPPMRELSRDDQDAMIASRRNLATRCEDARVRPCATTRSSLHRRRLGADVDDRCRTSRASSSALPISLRRPDAAGGDRHDHRPGADHLSPVDRRGVCRRRQRLPAGRPVDQRSRSDHRRSQPASPRCRRIREQRRARSPQP